MRERIVAVLGVLAALLSGANGAAGAAPRTGDLVGSIATHKVGETETLIGIARRYDLGFVELRAANPGVDPWLPGAGARLLLPAAHVLPEGPRDGIVINLAEQRLYYFSGPGEPVMSFPIGIGRQGWETPLGRTEVVGKRTNPTWIPPPSIRAEQPDLPAAVPPGPNNPLGAYALDLGWRGFVIHGTNKPDGIGRRVSHGCIRLYPEDIARLFERVTVGTRVTVIDQPVKLGRSGGELYLEVHPTQAQADEIEAQGRFTPAAVSDLAWRVVRAAADQAVRLDWPAIQRAAAERRGVPVRITR
ncbi:MAG: L,D-transpeptidase family protein [Kiloniellaceae bacterium]